MTAPKLRWGILGTAQIARKNWLAIHHSGNGTITAVASRSGDRAREFIRECQDRAPMDPSPAACDSYDSLLARPDVDAVYIPLPTGLRREWVIRAAHAGKHVVCEKPCASSVAELREMITACERNRVQFMDGVMFMHSARLAKIRETLDDGRSVGRLRRMNSHFSFAASEDFFADNIRLHSALEPFGCLGDLGWYCIRFMLWAMNGQMPLSVHGRLLAARGRPDSPVPVPVECSAELIFPGGVSGGFYCSFQTENQQTMTLSGTRGYLHLPDFVLPFLADQTSFEVFNSVFNVHGCDFKMEARTRRVAVNEHSNSAPDAQETRLFRNFAAQAHSGRLSPLWPEMALKTQQVMEMVMASVRSDVPSN